MRLYLFILILVSTAAQAQTDTAFFDKDWKQVSVADSAAYVRPPAVKQASGKYQVVDYYINSGQPQMLGEYLDSELKVEDGYFIRYYKNGKIESEGNSKNGKREGNWIRYYDNGIKAVEGQVNDNKWNGDVVYYYTNGNKHSEGAMLNGSRKGFWKWYAEDGKTLTFYATIKDGCYNGEVARYYTNGTIARRDIYKNCKFKSGKCYTKTGLDTTWFVDRSYPTFRGGDARYAEFVLNDERYKNFRKNNRKVRGVVYIEAYFDETGKVYNNEVVQSLRPDADRLALELVRAMPDWLPALDESNRPVKSTRTLDIKF